MDGIVLHISRPADCSYGRARLRFEVHQWNKAVEVSTGWKGSEVPPQANAHLTSSIPQPAPISPPRFLPPQVIGKDLLDVVPPTYQQVVRAALFGAA